MSPYDARQHPRILRGPGVVILSSLMGVALLALAAFRLARAASPAVSVAFVIGLGCGYVPSLVLRVADLIGRERLRRTRWLRRGLVVIWFVPLVGSVTTLALLSLPIARAIAGGTVTMLLLGFALLREPPLDEWWPRASGREH